MVIHRSYKIKETEEGFEIPFMNVLTPTLPKAKKEIDKMIDLGIEGEFADAHSCSSNAEYTEQGPEGPGFYCSFCGAPVSRTDM